VHLFADATDRPFPVQDDIVVLRILPAHVLFHASQDQGHRRCSPGEGQLSVLLGAVTLRPDFIEGERPPYKPDERPYKDHP
jgi:hypothetical protein